MSLTSYRAAPPRVTIGHYRWTASHRVQYINASERADEESRPVRRAAVDRWAYNTIHQAVNPDRSVIPNGRGRIEKCAHSSRPRALQRPDPVLPTSSTRPSQASSARGEGQKFPLDRKSVV